ncbi:MAG: hypothetical protein QFC55_00935 [Chloroflexota bacterium]|nr:hypothetical protein [Chloroflexota bacterium]
MAVSCRAVPTAALFVLTGVLWLAHGALIQAGADYLDPRQLIDFAAIYLFSAALLALAFAVPALGRLSSRRWAARVGLIGGIGSGTAAVVNILEDGLNIEWMFLPFVVSALTVTVALLVLTLAFALFEHGAYRLLAIVPLSGLLGFQGLLGGALALAAWLGAAAFVLLRHDLRRLQSGNG